MKCDNIEKCESLTDNTPKNGLNFNSSPTTAECPLWEALNNGVAPSCNKTTNNKIKSNMINCRVY